MAMLHDYLEKNGLAECEVSIFFLKLKLRTKQSEKAAAWSLFVELTTRITTQELKESDGLESAALKSIYDFFKIARATLVEEGRGAEEFSILTVYTLNHILRPFLASWHRKSEIHNAFSNSEECLLFRSELKKLQKELKALAFCLAKTAGIEPQLAETLLC